MAKSGSVVAVIIVVVIAIAVIGAALALQANQEDNGTMSLYVKDAPASWTHVNVTFSEVKIHAASGTNNSSGWITLTVENGTIDLVHLANISSLLASSSVPTGKYTQIRIVVAEVTGMMTDGTNVTFTVPSGELKTTHPFNVTAGQTTKLTVDIDLEHSIVHNAQGWTFKPVLGAVIEG
jgi:hypothetical protein